MLSTTALEEALRSCPTLGPQVIGEFNLLRRIANQLDDIVLLESLLAEGGFYYNYLLSGEDANLALKEAIIALVEMVKGTPEDI